MQEAAPAKPAPDIKLFHDVFNASPIGIAVENMEGQPLFVNPAFCSFFGCSEEELCNKHCVDFSPREDAEKDWALFQQLKAGNIDHYQLEKRYFRQDRSLVWGHLSISLLSSGPTPFVLAMVEDITAKKLAEEAQLRHSAIVESSEDAIISKNLDAVITSWNPGAQQIFGYNEQEALGKPITILVPRELLNEEQEILGKLKAGERIGHYETVRVTKAGERVPVSLCISPIKDATGTIVGFSKIARNLSEQKRAEQALAEMTRKLIEAQEQERSRIGRELHDDINQRLAMLALEVEDLQSDPSEIQSRARELRRHMAEVSNDVQALSHELHSSKLEYLGAVAGIKSWCKEFSERQKIEVDFRSDVHSVLPREIGLTLFRVLQEALHNVVKHSGVKHVEVQLREESGEIHAVVSDLGRGFDLNSAQQAKGLGLTSMRERVRLVNGKIAIHSEPITGTNIHVRIPLKPEHKSQREVG